MSGPPEPVAIAAAQTPPAQEDRPLALRVPVMLPLLLAGYAAMAGMFLALAGRSDLPWMWATLVTFCACHLVMALVLRRDPALIRERFRPGPGVPAWDRAWAKLGGALVFTAVVVAPLDAGRLGWTAPVPAPLRAVGLGLVVAGLALLTWAMATNTFFSRVVRIQEERGHHVVTDGPYRWVRHPGYLGWSALFVGFLLGIGSWVGVAVGSLSLVSVVYRTVKEDRFLHERLAGYADYAARVRWRLLPGVF